MASLYHDAITERLCESLGSRLSTKHLLQLRSDCTLTDYRLRIGCICRQTHMHYVTAERGGLDLEPISAEQQYR
jgi:hypothetical protein